PSDLLRLNAVNIEYHIMKTELTGKRIFNIWAALILKKSKNNPSNRNNLLKLFTYYLFFVIYVISPFASLIFRIKRLLLPRKTEKELLKNTSL
ncbi:MAG: hypothetical protein L3J56_11615, partial [Bacteroidales bacterium]|nr:hypothetical protein [Bacteroidales bacterium]